MQKPSDAGDGSPRSTATILAAGILADSDRIEETRGTYRVYAGGRHTATCVQREQGVSIIYNSVRELRFAVYCFRHLYLEHTGALLFLQGVRLTEVLGKAVCLVKGKPRPVWDPRPGLDDVTLVVPLDNPRGLGPEEVFNIYYAVLNRP
jgi:hypothetical protein